MSKFEGFRLGHTATVLKDGRPLDKAKSLKVRNHSPAGFEWGYGGSGPAQLALALLLEVTTEQLAVRYYQEFKFEVVGRFPYGQWVLFTDAILTWIADRPMEDPGDLFDIPDDNDPLKEV